MSDEKELNEQDLKLFAKGFNTGYLLEKDNPGLLNTLLSGKENKDKLFFQGLNAGRDEQKHEKYLDQAKKAEKSLKQEPTKKSQKTALELMDEQRKSRAEKANNTKEKDKSKDRGR